MSKFNTIVGKPVRRPTNMAHAFIDAAIRAGVTDGPWTARRVAENCNRERAGTVTDLCRADLSYKTRTYLGY